MEKEGVVRGKKKALSIIVIVLIIILTLIIILPKFPSFVVKKTFDYVLQNIVNVSGLSPWLVKGVLVFVLIPFYWGLLEVSRISLPLFQKRKPRRTLGKIIIVAYTGSFFLAMFFLSRGVYFGYVKGEATKYYAATPEGIRFFDSPGFDPKYGIVLKPVTPEMMEIYQKKTMGLRPKRVQIESMQDIEFFDPISGETRIWYFQDSKGNYEFFSGPGFHPTYHDELKPVTPAIIDRYQQSLDAKRSLAAEELARKYKEEEENRTASYIGKYINVSVKNRPNSKDAAVLIIDESSAERPDIEGNIARLLQGQDITPALSFFCGPFIDDKIFESIFMGNVDKISDLRMINGSDFLVLGKVTQDYKKSSQLANVISAEIRLEIKVYSTSNGKVLNSAILTVIGAGFSEQEAGKKAVELLNEKLATFLSDSGF